ncbi:MAG: type II toxin-antitoxin system prevent-host-death family antitoxin [Verrucomicrobiota bacterium]|jgi:prevent-host-death family protein
MMGLFEAKTKFSEVCAKVAKRREAVVITRRGRPIARIEPISPRHAAGSSVWTARREWEKKHGPLREEFDLPRRTLQTRRNPLGEK